MSQVYFKKEYIKHKINNYYRNIKKNNNIIDNYKNLCKTNIMYRIINSMYERIRKLIIRHNIEKIFTYSELFGCTIKELKNHLKIQFTENMTGARRKPSFSLADARTFDNYGDWEVDHIKLASKFNLTDNQQFKKCFNYKNLQPLWKEDNRQKSNKILEFTYNAPSR
jgi:hypothetical protein